MQRLTDMNLIYIHWYIFWESLPHHNYEQANLPKSLQPVLLVIQIFFKNRTKRFFTFRIVIVDRYSCCHLKNDESHQDTHGHPKIPRAHCHRIESKNLATKRDFKEKLMDLTFLTSTHSTLFTLKLNQLNNSHHLKGRAKKRIDLLTQVLKKMKSITLTFVTFSSKHVLKYYSRNHHYFNAI